MRAPPLAACGCGDGGFIVRYAVQRISGVGPWVATAH
jgi:hypothetical protein